MKSVAIAVTTYNDIDHFEKLLKSAETQSYRNIHIIVADDGSEENEKNKLVDLLEKSSVESTSFLLKHGERGIARYTAISKSIEKKFDYLLILDADMYMDDELIEKAIENVEHFKVGALALVEKPYSNYKNFFSKVKVFEREMVNNSGEFLDLNSIEAARFWDMHEYIKSGGINFKQIAFEEIQPTLRYIDLGGKIYRLSTHGVYHDEKKVTLKNIVGKKKYYFSHINKTFETEKGGFLKAVKRFYFFRPVLYEYDNVLSYFKHPILFLGMIFMYIVLSFVAVGEVIKSKVRALFLTKSVKSSGGE